MGEDIYGRIRAMIADGTYIGGDVLPEAELAGALIVAEWFPKSGDGTGDAYFNLGFADFGLAQLIAIVVILAVWAFNVLGVKPSLVVELQEQPPGDGPGGRRLDEPWCRFTFDVVLDAVTPIPSENQSGDAA